MPSFSAALVVDLLPGRRHLLDLVGAVVEERRVGLLRHAPALAVVGDRLERRRDELVLARLDVRRHVVEPLLGRELRRPDHVGGEDVALARLGLLALDELGALLVGATSGTRRSLADEALGLFFALNSLTDAFGVAGGVLAHAEGDVALGVVHRRGVDRPWRPRSSRSRSVLGAAAAAAVVVVAAGGDQAAHQRGAAEPARRRVDSHLTCEPLLGRSSDRVWP